MILIPGDQVLYKRKALLKEHVNAYSSSFVSEDSENKGFYVIRVHAHTPEFPRGRLLSVPVSFLTAVPTF